MGRMSVGRLEREITQLAAHIHAATCRWLCLVAEFDRRGGWERWGCASCADWVAWRCGLSKGAAREHVRVARRLGELPAIGEAFGLGRLSFSQVRALTRVATPETEAQLLEVARHSTAAQLERIVGQYRGVLAAERPDPQAAWERRFVSWDYESDGSLRLSARLPAEEGATVVAALLASQDFLREGASAETPDSGEPAHDVSAETPAVHRLPDRADALVLMAESALAGPAPRPPGEGREVVVHVDLDAIAQDGNGRCEVEGGPGLHPHTARRLACDAAMVAMLERDGQPLSVGRRTRTVPPGLRRALASRDQGCRFPGCDQSRWLHAHHIHHWSRGGKTELANLVQLCSHHHRLVHEGGYTVERRARGRLRFRRPDGREIPTAPRPRRGDHGAPARQHDRHGRDIDPDTCVARWDGEPPDYPWIVDSLVENDRRLRGP